MLIEKMPYHMVLIGGFLLFAVYIAVTQPVQLHGLDWPLLVFVMVAFTALLIGWRYASSYERKSTWCKWTVSLLYAALGAFFGLTFALACIERGVHKGIASVVLLSVGMAVAMLALTLRPGLAKRVNATIGALTVVAAMLVSRTGNGDSFVIFVFAPFIAATSALLGLVAWRDGAS